MGKVITTFYEGLVPDTPDRQKNVIRLEESNRPGQFHLHFRNLKIVLSEDDVREWKRAFLSAKENLGSFLEDDVV